MFDKQNVYLATLRRSMVKAPANPLPSSRNVPGSGTGEAEAFSIRNVGAPLLYPKVSLCKLGLDPRLRQK